MASAVTTSRSKGQDLRSLDAVVDASAVASESDGKGSQPRSERANIFPDASAIEGRIQMLNNNFSRATTGVKRL